MALPQDPLVSDRCGTPPYMPPEMWKGKPYSHEPDVWALGVTLSVLLTGLFPFTFTDADTCAVASCKDSITWDNIPWRCGPLAERFPPPPFHRPFH